LSRPTARNATRPIGSTRRRSSTSEGALTYGAKSRERVFITGATGFVGSHLAETFVEAGYRVRCSFRATSDTRWISNLPVELVPLNLAGSEEFNGALKGVDVVVHAAGITRARQEEDYFLVNAEGTRRLAEAAVGAGVKRFVLIGSLAARGPDDLTKDGRDHPESAYGRSKLEAEECLRALDERIEVVALRPVAVYGPRDTDFLPLLKMARRGFLVLPGEGLLQPVYVADVAQAALDAARKRPVGFGPYPVAESTSYSWQEVIVRLEQALERHIRVLSLPTAAFELAARAVERMAKARGSVPIFDERRARDLTVHTWTCDPSNTERALGWRAEVSLAEGLNLTARWCRKAGWL
jgi:nucleoside-diphosphate-sugar epimerase